MEQLNTETFLSQVFWTLIGFSLSFVIVKYKLLPAMQDILNTRSNMRQSYCDKIQRLKNKIQEIQHGNNILVEGLKEKHEKEIRSIKHHHLNKKQDIISDYKNSYDNEVQKVTEYDSPSQELIESLVQEVKK